MTTEDRPIPAHREAERYVLGSCLKDGRKFEIASSLEPADFSVQAEGVIFRRMKDLYIRGESSDRVMVAEELRRNDEFDSVGGLSFINSLDDGMPEILNLEHYVAKVMRGSLLRKCMYVGNELMAAAHLGRDDPRAILAATDKRIQQLWAESEQTQSAAESGSAALSRISSFATERRRQYEETGKPVMGILTGIPKLDELLNGLNPGLHVLAGGPGAGKTSFSLQLAVKACEQGVPTFYITYENTRDNLVLKAICARAGVVPRQIERGDAHAADFRKFETAASELQAPLALLTAIEGSMALQIGDVRAKISKELGARGGGPCLIVFDYMQRAAMSQGYSEMEARVSSIAGYLSDLAKRFQSPVLALSSQNRASGYSSTDLASLKHSGALEYGADTVMFLKEGDHYATHPARAVDLTVKKQRFGPVDDSVHLIFRPDIGVFREEETQCLDRQPGREKRAAAAIG